MSERDEAWRAYQETGADGETGRRAASVRVQETARLRYDAAVKWDERGSRGPRPVGTRERMEAAGIIARRWRPAATDAQGRRVSAWDPESR